MKQVIQIQNVIKRFGDRAVLNGINFNIHEGETLVIMNIKIDAV